MGLNPILQILNAGHGETPPCPQARFAVGDVVKVRRLKFLKHLPEIGAVAVVVPPHFPAEYALADATGRPRPLMISREARCVTYLIGFEGDPKPHHLRENYLLPSGEPPVTVAWRDDQSEAS